MKIRYQKNRLMNIIDFNINYMENILYVISHRKRKNKSINHLNNSNEYILFNPENKFIIK